MAATVGTSGFGTLLKRGDGGVGAGTQANVEWGSGNAKIRIKWGVAGTAGNGKNITVVVSGSSYVYTILTSSEISITVPTTATVAQVIANLEQQSVFDQYWQADFGATPGDGSGTITARTVTATSGGTDGTEVFTTVAEVVNVALNGRTLELIDATHMESPNTHREYLPSLLDSGEVQFDVNFLPGTASQSGLETDRANRTKRNWKLVFPNTTTPNTYSFSGYVTSFDVSAAIDDKMTGTATIKITGPITAS
jgi:hypothetical protein